MFYHLEKLNNELASRQEKNKNYSMRAFARDLSINPGTLSSILKGERAISREKADEVVSVLNLNSKERVHFLINHG